MKKNASALYSIKKPIEQSFELRKVIASSTLGNVHLAISKLSRKEFAVKEVWKDKLDSIERFNTEMAMILKIDHPNVLKVYEIFETQDKFQIVEELCEGGQLFEYIGARKKIKEKECAKFISQLCSALASVHQKGIMHRNVKPTKILLKNKADLSSMKLIDIGLFHQKSKISDPKTGFTFRSSEALQGKYMTVGDSWSVGVLLYLFFAGTHPFESNDPMKSIDLIRKGIFTFAKPCFSTASLELKDLLSKLLTQNSGRRFTVDQCLSHEWIVEIEKQEALISEKTLMNLNKLYASIMYENIIEVEEEQKVDKVAELAQRSAEKHKAEREERERIRREEREYEDFKKKDDELKRRKKIEDDKKKKQEEIERKEQEEAQRKERELLESQMREKERLAEEERKKKKREEEEERLKRKNEDDKKKKGDEEQKKQDALKRQNEEAQRLKEEQERKAQEELRKKNEEAQRLKDEQARRAQEELKKKNEEAKRLKDEEDRIKREQNQQKEDNRLKKRMIMKLVGEIPKSQLLKLKRIFQTIDIDQNGTLTLEELVQGMKSFQGAMSEEELNNIFTKMDEDKSGEVSQDEFIQAFSELMAVRNKEFIKSEFLKLDKDGSGSISQKEFSALMKSGKLPIGDVDVEELIELIDQDKDGKIDLSEFFEGFNVKD